MPKEELSEYLKRVFTYHPPKTDQPQRYETIRKAALGLSETITERCPDSPELDMAICKLREAVMWANAAIALNE